MAEIHRKRPLIVKRVSTFHKKGSKEKKKNIHVERLKKGGKIIGGAVWKGLKSIGTSLSDPKTQRRLGEIGENAGGMSRDFFYTGFGERPRKRRR